MKNAIDNYANGKQAEVIAWKGEHISANSNRFFCTECLESVALDVRGHFRHKNKTSQSIECEKRVNSIDKTIYERIGLPLFLCKISTSEFRLKIGFAPQEESLLNESSRLNSFLYIGESNKFKKMYKINNERFSSTNITLIPVDDMPNPSDRYTIKYSDDVPKEIIRKWTLQTDIWGVGQFFRFGDGPCRKIRQLGSITTDTDYYFLGSVSYFNNLTSFVDYTPVGLLKLNNKNQTVYKMKIHSNKFDKSVFDKISMVLRRNYKINLLFEESKLVPLWPPCVEDDNNMVFGMNASIAFMLISSPNDNPVLHRYSNRNYASTQLGTNKPLIYELSLEPREMAFSVDRTFNGNIQFVAQRNLKISELGCMVDILDENSKSVVLENSNIIKQQKYRLVSNCPTNIRITSKNGKDHCYKITNHDGIVVDNIDWGDIISFYTSLWSPIRTFKLPIPNLDTGIFDAILVSQITHFRGHSQAIDASVIALYNKINDLTKAKSIVKRYIRSGSIPRGVVSILFQKYGGK